MLSYSPAVWSLNAYPQGNAEHRNAGVWRMRTPGEGDTKHIILSYVSESTKCVLGSSGARSWWSLGNSCKAVTTFGSTQNGHRMMSRKWPCIQTSVIVVHWFIFCLTTSWKTYRFKFCLFSQYLINQRSFSWECSFYYPNIIFYYMSNILWVTTLTFIIFKKNLQLQFVCF